MNEHTYRLDTNFAKMDRIGLVGIEAFKTRVLARNYLGHTIAAWSNAIANSNRRLLGELIDPTEDIPVD